MMKLRRPAYVCLLASALALAATPAALDAQAQAARILVIHTHDPSAPGIALFKKALRDAVLREVSPQSEFYDELLDLDRFRDRNRGPQLARYLADKYGGFRIDLIVAEGTSALQFATERLQTLLPGVPVVYGVAYEPILDFNTLPSHVTGSIMPLSFAATLTLARQLQPDAERVVLVGGAATLDSVLLASAIRDLTPLMMGTPLEVLRNWTYKSLLIDLRDLPPRTIVILSSIRQDWSGQVFNSGDLIPTITKAASVPVYGIVRNWVGDGVVGGSVLDFEADGERVGRLAVRTLQRAPGQPLPAREITPPALVVDGRQLQKWGFAEHQLPRGTEVVYRAVSIWERYRALILIALVVLAAQSALITLLLLERRRRLQAQRAVADQVAYERMMAELTADAARHAPDDSPRALEDALARIGAYAGANAAVLGIRSSPAAEVRWSAGAADHDTATPAPLEIPLVADRVHLGSISFYHSSAAQWPPEQRGRLEAAAKLIAGALARERHARDLEETRGQVEHLARVAAVGQLAGAVSHELRQPLTAIRAAAEAGELLLARGTPDLAEVREIFQDIVKDDARAAAVIDHIRKLLRKETPTSGPVNLNEVCRVATQLVRRDAAFRGVRLDLSLDPRAPSVSGDAVQLQQMVLNLSLNALDAAAAGSGEPVVTVGTTARAGEVEVFVHDSGAGLSPDVERRLFESFFSTKAQGLGLGLAIVKAIADRHRGRVSAENGAAGGAVFRVVLPVPITAR